MSRANNHPLGENSSNLITLRATRNFFGKSENFASSLKTIQKSLRFINQWKESLLWKNPFPNDYFN
jgi:hypothetical protein